MILIADSGSTKTDWQLIDGGTKGAGFTTQGYNPYFWEQDALKVAIRVELGNKLTRNKISEVYFYGAGCSAQAQCGLISAALKENFPEAKIEVRHDLLGAARALCERSPGMVAILGTGSNSCYYDGNEVTENVPSLGFILGDEGSGVHIGKSLLRAFLYNELPQRLADHFSEKYNPTRENVLDAVYKKPLPNRYLASFTRFVQEHLADDYIAELAENCFKEFFDRQLCKYRNHKEAKLGVVGSVGFHFREVIKKVADKKGIELGKIIESPINAMAEYHIKFDNPET